ncbi:type I toxin-antitoxin system SymE family toxin [Spirosoma sp. RP8]|uniref:Type I toxin-antitoxin system SymE family toxin n=1 Tax=Spirosoma liriopis TaxID=2937440 RepID=A0ABT0HL68_9BACT|nr:SymE family type I addiction module toxin [Spirosoma liriopis]MCK8492898.1 type I toxin-antitoxin system SymE family toxin [Spirosoma liriopis]
MQRKRKLGYSARKNVYRQLIFSPSLNLQGKWMANAGFAIEQMVQVTVEKNKIISEA